MSKIITIIELLNRIANGEEVPKKIKYEKDILEYMPDVQDYFGVSKTGNGSFFNYLFVNKSTSSFINNTVETLEDEETIDIDSIEELHIGEVTTDERLRINELIKAVKQINKKIEEE